MVVVADDVLALFAVDIVFVPVAVGFVHVMVEVVKL